MIKFLQVSGIIIKNSRIWKRKIYFKLIRMNEESKRLSNFLNKNEFYFHNLNSRKKVKKIKFEFIHIICNSCHR